MPVANELIGSVYIYIHMDDEQLFSYSIESRLIWSLTLREGVEDVQRARHEFRPVCSSSGVTQIVQQADLWKTKLPAIWGVIYFFLWFFHGFSMVVPWFFLWLFHGFSTVVPWFFYDFSMVFLWLFHGFSMFFSIVFLWSWFSYGFSMVFLLFFHCFSMVLPCFSMVFLVG